jgi:predicted ester cyclase
MSIEEENKATTRRFWEMHDFKGIPPSEIKPTLDSIWPEIFNPDFIVHSGTTDMSLQQFIQYWTSRLYAFPDQECIVEDIIAEGDKVMLRLTIHGTHQGEFMGIPATRKKIVEEMVAIGHFENGRMSEGWGYYGPGGNVFQLLGISPPGQ